MSDNPSLDWISEIEVLDLLDKDAALIAESCGLPVLLSLWENLPSMQLYVSELPLQKARRRYIRKKAAEASKTGCELDVKRLALQLGVSERFVRYALAETEKKDERQGKLL